MSERTLVCLVPHTHWDREWYLPFQAFRMRLVELVDRLLDLMDADPRFTFTLDGQLATVDDYLEVRPEAEERIRARIAEGRLAVGPWQILMDEFLVSGETIVRNLEMGWRRGEELGGAMPVAYLPDMFGHVAQMPQILRRAGIEHAAAWRGVPAAIDRNAFRWVAPDGSSVRAEYLVRGYWGAAYVLMIPDRLAAKIELLEHTLRPFFGEGPVLAMYGTDHSEPLPELVDLVEGMNASQDRYRLEIATLAGYFSRINGSENGVPRWVGELRSAARANILMGVTSARIDVKAACARAERQLERYAEPLHALYGNGWPEPFFRMAWQRLIENSAHDSICGCSVDAVNDQVLVRYAEVEQIAGGLADRAVARVAERVPRGSVAIINPSPHARSGVVEVEVAIPDAWTDVGLELPDGRVLGTQEIGRNRPLLRTRDAPGHGVPELLGRLVHGRELFNRYLNGYDIDRIDGLRRVTFHVDDEADPAWLDVDELKHEIGFAAMSAPDDTWQLRVVARPRRTILANVPTPPLGWTSVRPVPIEGEVESPVSVDGTRIRNGRLEVGVAADGTFSIAAGDVAVAGVGKLVDDGDFGDSYNYAPPAVDSVVETPEAVDIDIRSRGPVRGQIAVTRTYRWPLAVEEDGAGRTERTALIPVTTVVELRAGEPFVRVSIELENRCADHRLRFHVPLPQAATTSLAEGQFAVVERGLEIEGGHGEVPLATFPARGFVDAGGLAILFDHVMEYEVIGGRELALTVLRAIGLISRNTNPYREEPAGPEIAIPRAQCRGPWRVEFALFPHAGSWREAGVLRAMEHYQHGFATASGTGPIEAAGGSKRGLELAGEGVGLSSLRRRGEWLELRVVCEDPEPRTAVVAGDFREARDADLLGRAGDSLAVHSGTLALDLRPWEIRTIQLRG
jgi:mannosylglycerate hydrolase